MPLRAPPRVAWRQGGQRQPRVDPGQGRVLRHLRRRLHPQARVHRAHPAVLHRRPPRLRADTAVLWQRGPERDRQGCRLHADGVLQVCPAGQEPLQRRLLRGNQRDVPPGGGARGRRHLHRLEVRGRVDLTPDARARLAVHLHSRGARRGRRPGECRGVLEAAAPVGDRRLRDPLHPPPVVVEEVQADARATHSIPVDRVVLSHRHRARDPAPGAAARDLLRPAPRVAVDLRARVGDLLRRLLPDAGDPRVVHPGHLPVGDLDACDRLLPDLLQGVVQRAARQGGRLAGNGNPQAELALQLHDPPAADARVPGHRVGGRHLPRLDQRVPHARNRVERDQHRHPLGIRVRRGYRGQAASHAAPALAAGRWGRWVKRPAHR